MKIDRLLAIVMVLLECDAITAKRLAERFEVSTRTIYRDLEAINRAGIPIVCMPGPKGGVSILKSYKVGKQLFSTNEIVCLLMGLESIRFGLAGERVSTAREKLGSLIPSEKQDETLAKSKQVVIDLNPWGCVAEPETHLQTLQKAIEEHTVIEFCYEDRNGKMTKKHVEPYRLLFKWNGWYMQGYCLDRNEVRTYKVMRIRDIANTDHPFTPRYLSEKELSPTLFDDSALPLVVLVVQGSAKEEIGVRFGHDCISAEKGDVSIAKVHMPINEQAASYLLSFGSQCECLEPLAMRSMIRNVAKKAVDQYSSKPDTCRKRRG